MILILIFSLDADGKPILIDNDNSSNDVDGQANGAAATDNNGSSNSAFDIAHLKELGVPPGPLPEIVPEVII